MDITPLSDSLSGDKALYDKAFKLVPGYRQQKICNLKNDAAKCRCLAAGLLLNYTTRTFISGSVSGSITGSLADNTPTVKISHFRSLFQPPSAPMHRNTITKPPALQMGSRILKSMKICILTFPTPEILRCVLLPVCPAVSTLRETARLNRPLRKDFFQKQNITGFMIQKMYLYRRNVFSVSGL